MCPTASELASGCSSTLWSLNVDVPECETDSRHLPQEVENGTFLSADPDTSPQRLTRCFLRDGKESVWWYRCTMPDLEVCNSLVNRTEHLKVGDFVVPSPDSVADLRSRHRGSFGPLISLWLGLETPRTVTGNFWVLRLMLSTVALWEMGRRDE